MDLYHIELKAEFDRHVAAADKGNGVTVAWFTEVTLSVESHIGPDLRFLWRFDCSIVPGLWDLDEEKYLLVPYEEEAQDGEEADDLEDMLKVPKVWLNLEKLNLLHVFELACPLRPACIDALRGTDEAHPTTLSLEELRQLRRWQRHAYMQTETLLPRDPAERLIRFRME